MVFTLESDNLPSYVKKQPLAIAKKWIDIFNRYFEEDDKVMAWTMANSWLARVIKFNQENLPTPEPEQAEMEIINVTFESPEEELVVRSIGGEEYLDFILADLKSDEYGTSYTKEFLAELAEQINSGDINGDFNHELQYKLKEMGIGMETIKERMKNKNGIAKVFKAIVEKGKLFIRTTFDKRYKKRILNSKGVSIEGAFVRNRATNKFEGGTIFGFSFIDDSTLKLGNSRAVRI